MPLFEFSCGKCGQTAELLVRSDERPACPACGSKQVMKHASAFAPMNGNGTPAEMPVGCGAASCCQLQGGGCLN